MLEPFLPNKLECKYVFTGDLLTYICSFQTGNNFYEISGDTAIINNYGYILRNRQDYVFTIKSFKYCLKKESIDKMKIILDRKQSCRSLYKRYDINYYIDIFEIAKIKNKKFLDLIEANIAIMDFIRPQDFMDFDIFEKGLPEFYKRYSNRIKFIRLNQYNLLKNNNIDTSSCIIKEDIRTIFIDNNLGHRYTEYCIFDKNGPYVICRQLNGYAYYIDIVKRTVRQEVESIQNWFHNILYHSNFHDDKEFVTDEYLFYSTPDNKKYAENFYNEEDEYFYDSEESMD